jgi:tetratricopeptide (TPR) repeat protein
MAGDLAMASAALDGLGTDGGADDADILLARGKYAFFTADFDAARAAAEQAQRLILAGERNWQVLDLVTLRGLLAHRSDQWFVQMGAELHRTREDPGMAGAIFDGYLCSAEYLLYGPTPYAEVLELARDLRGTAERSGARRAAAFARALSGEAALLSGDLDLAAAELAEASAAHRELGSAAGEAHSLQRLAEVRLARGDDAEARRLLERAFPLARSSIVAKHLLHRVFGTMIRAAASRPEAAEVGGRAVPAGRPAAGRCPVPVGADRSGRRCEQLEGDVVRVAERQTRTVARVHDLAVGHAQRVQAGRPLGQLGAARAAERHMVQARPPLVELVLASQVRKAVQPEHGVVTERVDDVPERPGVLVEDRAGAEDAGVPGLADRQVGHGHGDVRDGRDGS